MRDADFNKLKKNIIEIVGNKKNTIYSPKFFNLEKKKLAHTIKSTYVSTTNVINSEFVKKLKSYTKARYIVPTNSGTSALHLALLASGIKKSEEVLVPTYTFIGTVNAINYCEAIPHFVDSEPNHPNIDLDKLEMYLKKNCYKKKGFTFNKKTKKKIHSIIAVHVYGFAVDILKLKKILKDSNIKIIEDAAEAMGSFLKKKHLGTLSDIGILSFNGNKIITTGGGGALLTNSKKIFKTLFNLANVAKNNDQSFSHNTIGYNYLMPNLNSSLGEAQIKNIKKILLKKKKIFRKYIFRLKNIKNTSIINRTFGSPNYWYVCLVLNDKKNKRENLIKFLNKFKIKAIKPWKLIHQHLFYKNCPKMNLDNAEYLNERTLILPSSIL